MRPVDRRSLPGPIKEESVAIKIVIFTCFSEFSLLNSVANASFCEKSERFIFEIRAQEV